MRTDQHFRKLRAEPLECLPRSLGGTAVGTEEEVMDTVLPWTCLAFENRWPRY